VSIPPGLPFENTCRFHTQTSDKKNIGLGLLPPSATGACKNKSASYTRITCVRCHVRTTALETEALALPVREFGTVPFGLRKLDISYKHFKTLLKTYMFD